MKFMFSLASFILSLSVYSQEELLMNKYDFASIEYLIEQEVGRIVLPQIYKNIGIDISIVPLPAQRAQLEANTGKKDGEIMRIRTYGYENARSIRVPTPYYYLETMAFVLTKSQIVINEKEDLKRYRLAKVRGVKHTNNITKGFSDVYEMNSTESILKMLNKNKVDVVLTNTLDGNLVIKRLGFKNITQIKKPLAILPLYHYVFEKHKALVPLINEEIIRLKNSGELDQLIFIAEQKVINRHH